MSRRGYTILSICFDAIAAAAAWALFFVYRKSVIETEKFGYDVFMLDQKFYLGILVIPSFWLLLYWVTGTYRNVLRKSRLKEFGQTLGISLIGVLVIFFPCCSTIPSFHTKPIT